jgi:LAO/AO transport system kinase
MNIQSHIEGVLSGDRRVLARTITLIESSLPDHRQMAAGIIEGLLPHTGRAVRLGITGVPGVGKSTFIETFGMYLTAQGHRLAVLAVDPSSTRSRGSIMADKTRMEQLCIEPLAFIRPSPSGGSLGGVARKTRETMLLCEAAGFDIILVETVGVGQSETAVASMVDFFLVLMLAGAGDELQGIKKGVLEIADALAVNKADGDNVARAEQAKKAYETALHLLSPASPSWSPPVLTCSAKEKLGIDAIWQTVLAHKKAFEASGEFSAKRQQQALDWMWSLIEEGLKDRFYKNPAIVKALPGLKRAVVDGSLAPAAAADQLLFFLDKRESV